MESLDSVVQAILQSEVNWQFTRSSGPGGQHVNKTSTKVILRWKPADSKHLPEEVKIRLLLQVATRITEEGELVVSAQESRSQLANKELAGEKLADIIRKAYTRPRKRKPTKPGKSAIEKRLSGKKKQSEKKRWRRGED
ncbi:MAG: alternative ribosome rescue aminoacyl-tRNA hydrolase ArfB [Cyclobacteriaceae bacterium]